MAQKNDRINARLESHIDKRQRLDKVASKCRSLLHSTLHKHGEKVIKYNLRTEK